MCLVPLLLQPSLVLSVLLHCRDYYNCHRIVVTGCHLLRQGSIAFLRPVERQEIAQCRASPLASIGRTWCDQRATTSSIAASAAASLRQKSDSHCGAFPRFCFLLRQSRPIVELPKKFPLLLRSRPIQTRAAIPARGFGFIEFDLSAAPSSQKSLLELRSSASFHRLGGRFQTSDSRRERNAIPVCGPSSP